MKDCSICYEPKRQWAECRRCKNRWCVDCYDHMLALKCPFCRQNLHHLAFSVADDGDFEWRLEFMYCLVYQHPPVDPEFRIESVSEE